MQKKQKGLVWFRNDLRVADNTSLAQATKENNTVYAVYFFDPRAFKKSKLGAFKKTEKFRAKFCIESVQALKENLKKLNIPLFVYVENPEVRIAQLIKSWNIETVYYQQEWTAEESLIASNLRANTNKKIVFKTVYDQFLFHPDDIPFKIQDIPTVFTNFRTMCEKAAQVRLVVKPNSMPDENLIDTNTAIPSLVDLGFECFATDSRSAFPYQGGEDASLKRMKYYFEETKALSNYKTTRNGLIGTDYSSKLSSWLANGSISAKIIYWEIIAYEQKIEKNESTYWLFFELIWRDYFKYISLKYDSKIFSLHGIFDKQLDWLSSPKAINEWVNGQTPEPFVNANMIELQKTGFMSNRGRQNAASYFAKTLLLDWRIGAAYFESMLIDYDVHSNYGNWLYLSGVGNDPRDRKFNMALQAKQYDPKQEHQKLWLNQF